MYSVADSISMVGFFRRWVSREAVEPPESRKL
jgi:hypothetical protein